jgi:hypothetical protein
MDRATNSISLPHLYAWLSTDAAPIAADIQCDTDFADADRLVAPGFCWFRPGRTVPMITRSIIALLARLASARGTNTRASWVAVVSIVLTTCASSASPGLAGVIKFDILQGVGDFDFDFATTGEGKPGEWSIVRGNATQALAQTATDPTDNHFPLAIYRRFSGRNVYVSTRFMPISGAVDQAGGVVVRFTPASDYYVARANALENNVRFYRVIDGKREMIAGVDAPVSSQAWHTLGVVARDDHFTIVFDGRELFGATERTLPGPGRVGVWTKADSVIWFENINIKPLD